MQEKKIQIYPGKIVYMNVGEISVKIKDTWFALKSLQVSSQMSIKKEQKHTKIVLIIGKKKKKEKYR